jgi:selenocysteine lyase/cysteine desulfurase
MTSIDRRAFLAATATGLGTLSAAAATRIETDEDPLGVRSDFPMSETGVAYLDSAAVAPIPRIVREAGVEYLDRKMLRGSQNRHSEKADEARQRFADLFHVDLSEVALLYSTSDAENIAAKAADLETGRNIVIDELHFTTSFVLFRELEARYGVELRIVPHRGGRTYLEDFDSRIDDKTSLVSVAWVSNRNGFRQDLHDLAEIAHRKGALVYADAIQALGHFETNLDETGVDFAGSGSYKWLLSSFGVAPFYVRAEHLDRVRPDRFGHGQVEKELPDFRFELRKTARKYEYSNPAYGTVYQLNAGLGYLQNVGLSRIEKHSTALATTLRQGIAALGFEPFTPEGNASPIVSFEHGRDPDEMRKRLEKENVVVTLREGGKLLRAGVALFNNQNDVKRLLDVVASIA